MVVACTTIKQFGAKTNVKRQQTGTKRMWLQKKTKFGLNQPALSIHGRTFDTFVR